MNKISIPIAKPFLTREDAKNAYKTILSGWVTQGPRVEEFEEKFAKYVGAKHAVAVSSCTAALHLSMVVADIKPKDEVICPSLTFIATANSIRYVGAKPVFAEIDPHTYNIDPRHVKKLITRRTAAILIVHQMGMPADIDAFKSICTEYNLKLIEDAACAVGSEYKGEKIGSHSELVCFSFHPRKVITTGDGGMITTSNENYYKRLRRLRQHGMSIDDRTRHLSNGIISEKYLELGYNYRMTDIQAAVGLQQLKKLNNIVAERRKIARIYNQAFKNIKCIRIAKEETGYLSNYQSYPIYLSKNAPILRDTLMRRLLDKGIATRSGIMTSHREPAYQKYCKNLRLPLSEDVSDRSILLPLYVPMRKKEVDTVINEIQKNFA